MTESLAKYDAAAIGARILTVRGQKVILDTDLAAIYDVEVRRLNEQVKRNSAWFHQDFAFTLTAEEWEHVRALRSQNATLKRGRHRKYLPRVFTEHGTGKGRSHAAGSQVRSVAYSGLIHQEESRKSPGEHAICATKDGQIHFLALFSAAASCPAACTITRRSHRRFFSRVLRHEGRCPRCARVFAPQREVLKRIDGCFMGLGQGESPCLSLPDEAFEDPRLLADCPHCGKPLKFNPFFVDMGREAG